MRAWLQEPYPGVTKWSSFFQKWYEHKGKIIFVSLERTSNWCDPFQAVEANPRILTCHALLTRKGHQKNPHWKRSTCPPSVHFHRSLPKRGPINFRKVCWKSSKNSTFQEIQLWMTMACGRTCGVRRVTSEIIVRTISCAALLHHCFALVNTY